MTIMTKPRGAKSEEEGITTVINIILKFMNQIGCI
jgi:hypothetical protein